MRPTATSCGSAGRSPSSPRWWTASSSAGGAGAAPCAEARGRPPAGARMRIPLASGAWLDHEPDWLPLPEADRLLETLRDELPWEQRAIVLFGRRVLQPRLIAWAGDVGYRYSGQTLEPRPVTPA